MATRITVPHLDANIVDVTVTAWRKAIGDRVDPGEIVAELTTDKATFDLEAPCAGILLEILAAEKSVVPSGFILALLGDPGEKDPDAHGFNQTLMEKYRAEGGRRRSEVRNRRSDVGVQPGTKNQEPETKNQKPETSPPPPTLHPPPPATRVQATPRARRLAQEQGIDLARVHSETGTEVIDATVLHAYLRKVMRPSRVGGAPDGLVPPEREF